MKKTIVKISLAAIALLPLGACSDSPDTPDAGLTAEEQQLQKVTAHYVDNIVIPTYRNLADQTQELLEAIETLDADRTQKNLTAACEAWKASRQWWEWSEAFLFGPATNYGIDPHIDTWPLDRTELEKLLSNKAQMETFDAETAGANFGPGLLGFHGLEYIIFRNGAPRPVSEISDDEMRYAVAVAGDLRNQTFRLEAAWAGMDAISAAKRQILEEFELEPTENFGDYMLNAGNAGSIYRTLYAALEEILDGCETISDEVAFTKMGIPFSKEDVNYIESPHAYNSLQDFEDNIRGIEAVYLGGYEGNRNGALSVSAFIASKDANADKEVKEAIANAIAKIQAVPRPFVLNYSNPAVQDAIDACSRLTDAIAAASKSFK